MEIPVLATETSEGRISSKNNSNIENSDVVAHYSGEDRGNEEGKGSENESSNSKSNELGKPSVVEVEDEPNLMSRQGQVSLVMWKDKLQLGQLKDREVSATNREEEKRKNPEENLKEGPEILHLSQIKIQQWTQVTAKQNDEEALSRVKQICGTLEGDGIYHYENIDDFDDTNESYQPRRCSQFKGSRSLDPVQQRRNIIRCRYKLRRNGTASADVSCKGKVIEDDEEDLRLYLLGRIALRKKIIRCIQKGCNYVYDPREVAQFLNHYPAFAWSENTAIDPRKNLALHSMTLREKLHLRKKESSLLPKTRESEPKENWWRRKSETSKTKLFKLLKTCDARRMPVLSVSVGKADDCSEVKTNKLIRYKYECTNCMEGFNENPEHNSDETCHQWKKQESNSSADENQDQVLTHPEVSKPLSHKADPGVNSSDDCKRCPGKKCNKAFHMFKCRIFGSNNFSKRRRIVNYVGYGTGLAVGATVVGTLVIGTGAVALATLIAIGSLSPPVFLSMKVHKHHKLHSSSACRRRLSAVGGASLGVLALPILSAWGVYKTVRKASKKVTKIVNHLLPPEDESDLHPKLKVAKNTWELNS